MEMRRAMEVLNDAGIKAVESTALKNGKEIAALRIGNGVVSPIIYQAALDSMESEEQLIAFATNAIASAPSFDVKEMFSKEYFEEHAISCVRHQTDDDVTIKFPVYGDLEEYIRIIVDTDDESLGSIVLTKEHVKTLGIDADEIREISRQHLREQASIRSMNEVMLEMMGASAEELPLPAEDIMFVATTNSKTHGASVMLLDDLLSDFCRNRGIKSAVIIPSSVHEVLIICSESDDSEINSMIDEVNETQVNENERLSSHCYHFHLEDCEKGCA